MNLSQKHRVITAACLCVTIAVASALAELTDQELAVTAPYARLAQAAYDAETREGWNLRDSDSVISGMKYAVYERPKSDGGVEVVVAFAGTDPFDLRDYVTNLTQHVRVAGEPPAAYQEADALVQQIAGTLTTNDSLVVTGHSYGGGLAQYTVTMTPELITNAFVFNSASLGGGTIDWVEQHHGEDRLVEAHKKISNIRMEGDGVSNPSLFGFDVSGAQLGQSETLKPSRNSEIVKLMQDMEILRAQRDAVAEDLRWWEVTTGVGAATRAMYLGTLDAKIANGKKNLFLAQHAIKNVVAELDTFEQEYMVPIGPESSPSIVANPSDNDNQGQDQRDDQRQQVLVQSGTLDLARRRAFNAVDVFFLADNTGSMRGEIAEVKDKAQDILDALAGSDPRFADVNIEWGVGRYSDDQVASPSSTGYELLQPITDDKAAVQAGLNQWRIWGGGTEGAFWALHQAATDGEGTPRHPDNVRVATEQETGWREGAAKVIVLFGDEPSQQESINEKELRELLDGENVAVSIIDSGTQNGGPNGTTWDATSGQQLDHAAEELTDGTGGAYIELISTNELVDAILAATFDAIAQNERTGGQLTRITDSRAWRIRTPSSVEATTPDGGDTFDFTLRFPGETDSTFSVDLTSGAATLGKDYLETSSVTGANNLFGADLSATSLVQFTEEKDFLRFVFANASGAEVEGYYGDRLDSLPGSGTTTFDLSSRSLSPYDGDVYAGGTAADVMDTRMSVNWSTGKVFAYDPTSPNPEPGVGIFIGEVNAATNKAEGSYTAIAERETAGESASVPRYIQDTARGNTNLQLYGESAPAGIGGTFSVNWHNENGTASYTSFLASGFADSTVAGPTSVGTGETWQGFAAALIIDRSDGSTTAAVNDDASDVAMTFYPNSGEFEGSIEVSNGSTHTLETDREDSAFVSSDAFGAVKQENGTPAHIATDTEESSQYDYASWGTWSKDSSGSPQQSVPARSPWIAGRLTPSGDVPTSGSATYSGEAWGQLNESGSFTTVSGDVSLNADFGSRTLNGSFGSMRRADGSVWTTGANVNTGWASGQNAIRGSINANNGMAGDVNGAFFGPNAEEVGGNWHLQGGGDTAAGAFRGKR